MLRETKENGKAMKLLLEKKEEELREQLKLTEEYKVCLKSAYS